MIISQRKYCPNVEMLDTFRKFTNIYISETGSFFIVWLMYNRNYCQYWLKGRLSLSKRKAAVHLSLGQDSSFTAYIYINDRSLIAFRNLHMTGLPFHVKTLVIKTRLKSF